MWQESLKGCSSGINHSGTCGYEKTLCHKHRLDTTIIQLGQTPLVAQHLTKTLRQLKI